MLYLILLIILVILYFKFIRKWKVPKLNAIVMFTGGVKCGKSSLSVYTAVSNYKKRLRLWHIRKFFRKMFFIKKQEDMPLLYSNVPLNVKFGYVFVTTDLLLRKKRFVYGSVVYLQEMSLVADSMLIRDGHINCELQLFVKLFGHETRGGLLVLDTHCIADNHFSVKRGISSYFYIHHLVRWLPFVLVAKVNELYYSDDGNLTNINCNGDIEDNLKTIVFPKRVWKWFDSYSYSSLTDNLPVVNNVVNADSLKVDKVVSFRKEFNFDLNEKK